MAAAPEPLPRLRTRRLALRALRRGDLEGLVRLDTDARGRRQAGHARAVSRASSCQRST